MKFFRKTDVKVIVALLAVSIILLSYNHFFTKDGEAKAEIYLESELVKTVSLSEHKDTTFSIEGKPAVIFHLYEDDSIAFVESDCPDKVCIHSGRLHIIGQSAACLPNGIILKIVPTDGNGYSENDVVI